MKNIFLIQICIILIHVQFTKPTFAEENLLTLKQQLDRVQREVNDLSKAVFQNSNQSLNENTINTQDSQTINFSAIDIRIYDLEKDIKNLNSNLEEFIFKIDEINNKINQMENEFDIKIQNYINSNSNLLNNKQSAEVLETEKKINEEETLGTLVITKTEENQVIEETDDQAIKDSNDEEKISEKLSPEEQFQLAFDQIRNKKYSEAKESFLNFITNNEGNQLSGSAHYWLGELYFLDKNFREAALILAEGYQNYPQSIKAPDMLYKLSEALLEIGKVKESCNTLNKISDDFSTHKIKNKAEKKKLEISCELSSE